MSNQPGAASSRLPFWLALVGGLVAGAFIFTLATGGLSRLLGNKAGDSGSVGSAVVASSSEKTAGNSAAQLDPVMPLPETGVDGVPVSTGGGDEMPPVQLPADATEPDRPVAPAGPVEPARPVDPSIWLGTDGGGLCPSDRKVTDAGVFKHPTFGDVILAVCGNRYPDEGYNPGDNVMSDDVIGLLDRNGGVLWSYETETCSFGYSTLQLARPMQDKSGNIFLEYFSGGAHCCGEVVILSPTRTGMEFLVGNSLTGQWDENFAIGDPGVSLEMNPSGYYDVIVYDNDYEPNYAEGTVTETRFSWNSSAFQYQEVGSQSTPSTAQPAIEVKADPGVDSNGNPPPADFPVVGQIGCIHAYNGYRNRNWAGANLYESPSTATAVVGTLADNVCFEVHDGELWTDANGHQWLHAKAPVMTVTPNFDGAGWVSVFDGVTGDYEWYGRG